MNKKQYHLNVVKGFTDVVSSFIIYFIIFLQSSKFDY